jgi:hypothetical protein
MAFVRHPRAADQIETLDHVIMGNPNRRLLQELGHCAEFNGVIPLESKESLLF